MLLACGGSTRQGPPPEILPPYPHLDSIPPPQAPLSTVKIPITVDLAPLLAKARAVVPESLGAPAYQEDFGTGGTGKPACGIACGYRVKRGPISFRSRGLSLEFLGSLDYGFLCHKRIPCFGPHFRAGCGWDKEPPRRLDFRYAASLAVRKDWSTEVHTRLDSLTAGDPCKVSLLKIDVTRLLLKGAEKAYAKAAPRLDSAVNERLALRARAAKVWRQLSQPIPLAEGVFLDINPQTLSAASPSLDSSAFRISLGLGARPSVRVGSAPDTVPSRLPDLAKAGGADHFRLFLPILVDYAEVNLRLRKRFNLDSGGFRYPEKGLLRLVIEQVEFRGRGDRVLVAARFRGAVRGTVYMIGRPRYDTLAQVLSVDSLAYSLESRGPMLKAAGWLRHDDFLEKVRERLTFELAGPIGILRGKVEQALNGDHGKLRFSGTVDHMDFASVRSLDGRNALQVDFQAAGKLKVTIVPEPD